jgi:hypothetical protein
LAWGPDGCTVVRLSSFGGKEIAMGSAKCEYCSTDIDANARKCPNCGEAQERWRFGRFLGHGLPLLSTSFSILVPLISISFAWYESHAAQNAQQRAERATFRQVAAEQAVTELVQKLTPQTKEEMLGDLRSEPEIPLRPMEGKLRTVPENLTIQKKALLYQALKDSD